MNIAYTEEYEQRRKNSDDYFMPQYLRNCSEKIVQFTDKYSVKSRFYSGEKDGYPCIMSENELLDGNEDVIYTWRNLDGNGVVSLFKHSNDRHYLIFCIELYGYSVLEIESGLTFNYIPSQSYPRDSETFEETFIWLDASYDPKSNLLAVGGCFWACPESVLVLDFTDPLCEHPAEMWKDVHTELDADYNLYGHISFDHWEENGDLCVKVCNINTDKDENMYLSAGKLKDCYFLT